VWEAHSAGLQVSLHAIGDAAIEQLLRAFERALQKEPRAGHRHRIEHFSLPTASQIERLARLGVTASMQPNFAAHPRLDEAGRRTGQGLEALLGAERFERRLTACEALQLYTVNAARAAFEEAEKGTLSVGKLADLVALADDPLRASPASLASIPVELTMVGGRVAYQRAGGT